MIKLISNFLWLCLVLMMIVGQSAYGHDRHYALSEDMRSWFQTLKSGKGPCCADADGSVLQDIDWESIGGHYRVRIEGNWIEVPDDAVIIGPNKYGPTMVWPLRISNEITIRCFLPGSMT